MTVLTLTHTAVLCTLKQPEMATLLEEYLWTLPDVASVTHHCDGEIFLALEVMSANPQFDEVVRAFCAESPMRDWIASIETRVILEQDWAESWKAFWHVERILPQLVIQPSWEPYLPQAGEIVLQLDPGSAFGTGSHPTTRLMLWFLSEFSPLPQQLLDVGTGSGILALYAAKKGIRQITATDNDPKALVVAETNALQNNVTGIMWSTKALSELPTGQFEAIVANILANTLCEMMPELRRLLTQDGQLALSGITMAQRGQMLAALAENGLKPKQILQQGDWLMMVATPSKG